jgi:antagonist of KipI
MGVDGAMTSWRVQSPGTLTTVQDRGREGMRHLGIAHGGALDPASAWLANMLVGNDEDHALLEITLQGPVLQLPQAATIAITGAAIDARAGDWAVPMNRPVMLPPCTLTLGPARGGVRSYLAVAGGFATPAVLGSRSTDLRGGFGGVEGRALRAGDALQVELQDTGAVDSPTATRWWINDDMSARASDRLPIRFVASAHPAARALAQAQWRASPRSDRQGLRLQGEPLVVEAGSGISEPVAPGCIQLPADGQPIVLLADAQTVGGYPRLGHVIGADLSRLAQLTPGVPLRFNAVSLADAHRAACAELERRARIALAIKARAA